MSQRRLGSVFLNLTLIVCGLVMLALAYGFITRQFSTQTTPSVGAESSTLRGGEEDAGLLGEIAGDPIQVGVRNAAGVDDLARVTTLYLRDQGFDVVDVGNAPGQGETTIVVLNGTMDHAMRVATALDVPAARIETGSREDYDPDVAVHIGSDYLSLAPFEDAAPSDSTN